MKISTLFVALLLAMVVSCSQNGEMSLQTQTDANGYTYEYVPGDGSDTRIYTLDNGLKVYLSPNDKQPRVQALMPIKAGGKYDPAHSTGLAHYLEHMMFKGTSDFGTKDWESEKVYIDSIEMMFETYRGLTDPEQRKAYYAKIDAVSNQASQFAIANEYDKMMSLIGSQGTNAYTTEDRTVYMENIPSNQLENFLEIQANRFSMIVNRLFHTELEAVYEEKNRSLDNDGWKAYENLYAQMFEGHPYGEQTVIGTIEHLKNPSISDINAYFEKYYVPDNMALCLSGELDPEETIQLVDRYFGKIPASGIEGYQPIVAEPKESISMDTVYGPNPAFVQFAYRAPGTSSPDFIKLQVVDYLLANNLAGLIDLNLVQQQKILSGYSYVDNMNDYSLHVFHGLPREGQSLEEVRDLLMGEIEKIKAGEFEDWLVKAVINDFKKSQMSQLESDYARANDMVVAFTNDIPWDRYVSRILAMEKLTKEDIVAFAHELYQDNYGLVYKVEGEDPNKIQVEKPAITKVDVDRDSRSEFARMIEGREVPSIEPRFIQYEEEIQQADLKGKVPLLYHNNDRNSLFYLTYLFDYGTNEDPAIGIALDYLEYLGTSQKPSEEIKKEFYRLGCGFNVFSANERIYIQLNGLDENMDQGIALLESLLQDPQPDEDVLRNMISDMHKSRSDAKKDKGTILWQGLMNYSRYGEESPFTNVLSNDDLEALTPQPLLDRISGLLNTEHRILYFGPRDLDETVASLEKDHFIPESLNPVPVRKEFAELDSADPKVFFTHYDMVQAEIIFQSQGQKYDPELSPEVQVFNEYFGGNMGSVLFQEIREAQGLAYSVFSSYSQGSRKDRNDYIMAYVGTQADKQPEAMDALVDLINNLPESELSFENARESILKTIESQRITGNSLLFNYINSRERGLDYDIREKVYNRVQEMTFDDLKAFHEKHIKNKTYNVALVGDRDKINFVALDKYGEVREISLDELFGYEEKDRSILN